MNENQTAPNMDFDERNENGEIFAADCKLYCQSTSDFVAENGYEFTHPELVKLINSDPSIEARLIRYRPDLIEIWKGKVIQIECKASMTIEKDAYDMYMLFHSIGYRIKIFALDKYHDNVFSQYIQEIEFRGTVEKNNSSGSRKPYKIMDHNSMKRIYKFRQIVDLRKAQNEMV